MKILDKIIISPTPPTSKNVAWFDGKEIKVPSQGEWKSVGGTGGSADMMNIINSLYLSEMNDDFNNDFAI